MYTTGKGFALFFRPCNVKTLKEKEHWWKVSVSLHRELVSSLLCGSVLVKLFTA